MDKCNREYDKNNNLVHYISVTGNECWQEFSGNRVYLIDSKGYEEWREYDENNNLIHFKDNTKYEVWYKWEDDVQIDITEYNLERIKCRKIEKEFLSREEIPRFDLMEL